MPDSTIIYTHTDEAPLLATYSFLPIIQAYAGAAGVAVETRDISLAGRIIAAFPDHLTEDQRTSDALAELGELAKTSEANIIKLPNVSASIPQLKDAIAELQGKGYALPDYPDDPQNGAARDTRARYDRIKGSAVNPVLREGNSDRRAPASVKQYARKHPHSMGAWTSDSKTNVAHMTAEDFRSNEKSAVIEGDGSLRIELVGDDGTTTVLRDSVAVLAGEVVDATVMRVAALRDFVDAQIARAKADGVLFSVHLKATMMKVSDPIIFGHVVRAFFPALFAEHGDALAEAGINPNDGLGTLLESLDQLSDRKAAIEAAVEEGLAAGPALAMVDSDRGITNLHVPSDTIVDASMPAMIRTSGHMWGPDGEEHDTLAVIPDSSYAGIYQAVIDDCRAHGAFDPATMGSVPNVGLMAQAAEEYGSHDKTFEIPATGTVRVVDGSGATILEHHVSAGDIWRMCQTKDVPIRDWVKLAVTRARASGAPAVFWLDESRAHDANLIAKVRAYLSDHDTNGLQIEVKAPVDAMAYSLERIRRGEDTIGCTGNVLRDYLTDLFPIMELGTSAKMLSIVPLINGGGLFETGAGGSAPKHVQQLVKENHLRWDSLGEFFALAASFEHLANHTANKRAQILADTLDLATGTFLEENKSPGRKVHQLDNRGSHFYLALFWAQELAAQSADPELAAAFAPLAERLAADEEVIAAELLAVQGEMADLGGYYSPDPVMATEVMRPSKTFNADLAGLSAVVEAYSVDAHNTATASTNKIHDDDVARRFGFRGGLVPGVDVYAYLCHPPAARWGREWLQHGTMRARFHVPVYDGHEVHISSPDGERLELHDEEGGLCADGAAALGGPVSAPDADDWPDVPQTISPPPASPEVLVPGTAFGLAPHGFHAVKQIEYLADIREELPIYREHGIAHPGWILRDANYVLSSNVRLGPWIHVESVVQHFATVEDGQQVGCRGIVREEWEHKGHRFVRMDVLHTADGAPVARTDHTAIYRPRGT